MKRISLYESANEIEEKSYVVVLRFVKGFTPIMEGNEVNGASTSVNFKHTGDVEEAKQAYLDKLAEVGLHPDGIDFTEEVSKPFDAEKAVDMILDKE